MSILVIAEKPSVARDIAKVLGCQKKGDGFLHGENYIVSWAIGHLVGLCEPEEYDERYKKWNMDTLPIIPDCMKLKVLPKTKSQFTVLKRLMNAKETDEIICATDSGREGELIFRYIYSLVRCKKPFKRLWISSMTDAAIKKGFAGLKPGSEYDCLFNSARCRSEADWLVGMNASRAYTINYGVLLSVGRVQTPTLSLIVANKKEIDAFVPEKYWEVEAVFAVPGYKGIWFDGETNKTRIANLEEATRISQLVSGKPSTVTDIKTEEKKIPPPLLFDLTELQRECNKRYGMSAKSTLDTAQVLYEKHKVITYPRTDSRYLSTDMAGGVRRVLESFKGALGELAKYPLSFPSLNITKRIADDSKVTDHHAIIPTGKSSGNLTDAEGKVYDLIARRLIAAFYPYYEYNSTRVVTVVEGESFLSKGQVIVSPGWTEVLGRYEDKVVKGGGKDRSRKKGESASECEATAELPELQVGHTGETVSAKTVEKVTTPPKPYTEATLLSAMEHAGRFVEDGDLKESLKDSGLGTPATRAAVIERLIDVGYVVRVKKALTATEKGVKLIDIVPDELKSPETTAKWERALSLIAKGKMEPERFGKSIERYVRYIVSESRKINRDVVFDREAENKPNGKVRKRGRTASFGNCPLCGGSVFENTKAFYCDRWKTGCGFTLWKSSLEKSGAELGGELVKRLLADGKAENIPVFLSSTRERGNCTVVLNRETPGFIGISNFVREEG